jgi:GT2 family glycosyltransferase
MNPAAQNDVHRPVDTALRILVVSDFFPEDKHDDGPWLMQVLRALRELGLEVVFFARDDKDRDTVEPILRQLGIRVGAGDGERLCGLGYDARPENEFAKALAENDFSLAILVNNFRAKITVPEHYLQEIRKHSPKTRIAVLTGHIYSRLVARQAEVSQRHEHYEVAQDWSAREWEGLRRADLVMVNHERNAEWLRLQDSALEIGVVPSLWQDGPPGRGWKARKGILFAPDFQRQGDVDGFVWFLQKVWTLISREAHDVALLICGGEEIPAASRQKLPQVKWFGTEDLQRLVESARLFVSPLRFGIAKNSPLLMLANGLPGVTSNFAAECEGLTAGTGILTADTPEDFARAVLRIYRSKQTWEELAASGRALIRHHCSGDALKRQLTEVLERASRLTPKPPADGPFSVTLVDTLFRDQLLGAASERRVGLRLDYHAQLAEHLLHAGDPQAARRQLRHIYSWLGESIRPGSPLARLLSLLARCYRELGERAMVARCGAEARLCFPAQAPGGIPSARKSNSAGQPDDPKISLIVPTYNRLPILKKCLLALEAQSISPQQFEVIVIDDGASDGTEEAMRQYHPPFRFQYLRQANSGTGAARRNGVEHATGEYLLLMNDDTICAANVVEEHLCAHRKYPSECWAVLGNFEYPAEARRRAMSYFLRTKSFMFPQMDMEEGFPYPYANFITCNLSIRRDAVLQAGSFDATYKLSEDTELGIRLFEMGYGVLYHPAAHAWHDHLPYAVGNLIRRAKVYGADYFYMFRRHPRVIKEWAMPLDLAGEAIQVASRIAAYLEKNRRDVEAAAAALEKWDAVDFEPVLANPREADFVLSLFQQAVPAIHWFYLFESMLQTMTRELQLVGPAVPAALAMGSTAG